MWENYCQLWEINMGMSVSVWLRAQGDRLFYLSIAGNLIFISSKKKHGESYRNIKIKGNFLCDIVSKSF